MIVYTDGSQKHTHHHFRRVGSAAVGFIRNQETFTAQLGLGGKAEVYNAELTGILIGLHHAQSEAEKHPLINCKGTPPFLPLNGMTTLRSYSSLFTSDT